MRSNIFRAILIALLTLPAAIWHAPVTAVSLSDNDSKTPSTGAAADTLLLDNTSTFLPVEQAFRVDPQVTQNKVTLDWQMAPGYYLYRHMFAFSVQRGTSSVPLANPQFEAGQFIYDEYYGRELEVFYRQTRVAATLPDTPEVIHLLVSSQGCADAGLCYPPRTQIFEIDRSTGAATEITATTPANIGTLEPDAPQINSNVALMLLFATLGGAILNLMPCVFPVLSIKALNLASSHHDKTRQHLHSAAYAGGIVLSFVVIAGIMIALRSAGQAVGWGFQLQSPAVITFLACLFFVIAQMFAGQLTIGTRWMGLGQHLTEGTSMLSSFTTGILATVVASPCTAPFMGTAIGVALTQSPQVSLAIFAAVGLGMALPFLLLTWIPGLLQLMPRPGPWMQTFSQVLAFPLYGSVLWLLWVLGRQTDIDHVIAVASGLLLLAFALWLLRRTQGISGRACALIVAGCALAIVVVSAKPINTRPASWQHYSEAKLEALRTAGEPVFINLTAAWCITCLANEKIALDSPEFHQLLVEQGITYLKGDWTNADAEITRLLNHHNRNGVPLYLYYGREGAPVKVLPQLLTPGIVSAALKDG